MDEPSTTAPRWLNEQEARAWRSFTRLRIELEAALGRRLAQRSGLSHADYAVLVELSEAPQERLRPYRLGRALRWEKSRLSHHVKRMEARGLVCRVQCADDARGSHVALTEAGRCAIEAAAPAHVEDVRHLMLDHLDPEQLEHLTSISQQVLVALEREAGCGDD